MTRSPVKPLVSPHTFILFSTVSILLHFRTFNQHGHHNATSKFLFYRLDYNYKLSLRVLTNTKPGIAKRKTATSMKLVFFKPGFHMIVPVVSKKCSDDRNDHIETLPRRSQTTRTTETTSIAWIELSSIRTIGTIA